MSAQPSTAQPSTQVWYPVQRGRNPYVAPQTRPAKNAPVPHAGTCRCCGGFRR